MMLQHRKIKQKYPDAILLFRVGDFYETFGEDAIRASKILGITLTKRNNGSASASELAGFPHHALDTYLHKLVKAGFRVAICDQLEDPKTAKGVVKRGVTEMVTPGTATNEKLLEHGTNNFLCGLHLNENKSGIAFLDLSTGEFLVAEGDLDYIDKLLQTFRPAEVVFQRSQQKQFKERFGPDFYTYTLETWIFDLPFAQESLQNHFQVHSLKGFGIEEMPEAIIAAGAVLHYLKDTEHPHLQHIISIQRIDRKDYLWMDRFTVRNLEITGSSFEHGNSLLKVLDHTASPMGARLLKRWMLLPLLDKNKIEQRLNLVEYFIRDTDLRTTIIHHIGQTGDIERLVSRIPLKKINPREVLQLARGLHHVGEIKKLCDKIPDELLESLCSRLQPCELLIQRINDQISQNPPVQAAKGRVIRDGVNAELDELRNLAFNGKQWLASLQQQEAEATGISSLKIAFNNVFGYYLEVTHAHKNKVPAHWIRKQTLTSAERYITPELKEYEEKIMGAEEKMLQIEMVLFEELLRALQEYLSPMQLNGSLIAAMDCLSCFAYLAIKYQYKKPELHEGDELILKDSRHPVIERNLPPGESFISNDLTLNRDSQQIIILTGPNMSGKSALLRQTALITLMAHAGSFVPASQARIPLTDKIFTRVGASDNLSGGESTFMVEMNETASIINNITAASLVLLDEIGRGTSTYDGISIAWSIAEWLHNSPASPKTLFATHYHELNELENQLPRIKNYHITNKESGSKIIFLRKVAPGGSTHSFGIHVARMAGMPPGLLNRAKEILKQLEESREHQAGSDQGRPFFQSQAKPPNFQLSIFDAHSETFESMRNLLEKTDINRLTPLEALLKLEEIKSLLK
jgi:DNA mismatch repair protein MutS